MDPRLFAFFLAEAGAIKRQRMAETASAVRAGFSTETGFNAFIAQLELFQSKEEMSEDTWFMLGMKGKG